MCFETSCKQSGCKKITKFLEDNLQKYIFGIAHFLEANLHRYKDEATTQNQETLARRPRPAPPLPLSNCRGYTKMVTVETHLLGAANLDLLAGRRGSNSYTTKNASKKSASSIKTQTRSQTERISAMEEPPSRQRRKSNCR
eukprot:c2810_g1_i1 orf=443-865(-)